MPRAVARDGLPEREARATIHSMFSRPPRSPAYGTTNGGGPIAPFVVIRKPPSKPSIKYELAEDFKLPGAMTDPTRTLLNALFKPSERIQFVRAVTNEEGKDVPSRDHQSIQSLESWLTRINRADGDAPKVIFMAGDGPHGMFFCVNPLGKTERRLQENIFAYRHALIEFDSIPKEKQYQLIIKSRIPCAAIIDSGAKSIHAIVKINARDPMEYKERIVALMDHFREWGVDPANKDPTRLSRLPGFVRGDTHKPQLLLNLSCGCATFEEWQAEQASASDELPDPMPSIAELRTFDPTKDPNNLVGDRFLCKGSAFIISGQSGIGKSSFGLQMALCWAVGRDFFGVKAVRSLKVMIVQSENDLGDMAEAVTGITNGCTFTPEEIRVADENVRIFRDSSHTGEQFISMLHSMIAKYRPDIVLIDPLLSVVGDDICEAKVIGEFFRRGLNAMMQVTGVVVIFMHHVPKPREERKGVTTKDLSYSGSGSSDLTNWPRAIGVLQKLGNLDAYQFIMAKREKRTGMLSEEGTPTDTIQLQHGKDGIYWERMDTGMREKWEEAKEEAAKRSRGGAARIKINHTEGRVGALDQFLKENPDATGRELTAHIERIYQIGDRKAREVLKDLIEQEMIFRSEPEGKGKPAKFTFGGCGDHTP
jgi:RecA-family ATPase